MTPPGPPPVGHRPFRSDEEAEEFCRAFEACTLPKSAWTHRAHLTAALWHRMRGGPEDALARMRSGIKRFNRAVGTRDTETSGYHETITVLYLRIVGAYYRGADPALGLARLANDLYDRLGARDLPLRYYTQDRLMSVEARARWLEPDRTPLPADG